MSQFTGLLNSNFKTLYKDLITEAIRGFSVNCRLIYGDTIFTDCQNCIFDSTSGRSSGRYKNGGPIPFNFGQCPYCRGLGKLATEHTDDISLAPIYNYKEWLPTAISMGIQNPSGMIQTIGHFEDIDNLRRAKEIIVDTDVLDYVTSRFVLYGEPEILGFGESTFLSVIWKRVKA